MTLGSPTCSRAEIKTISKKLKTFIKDWVSREEYCRTGEAISDHTSNERQYDSSCTLNLCLRVDDHVRTFLQGDWGPSFPTRCRFSMQAWKSFAEGTYYQWYQRLMAQVDVLSWLCFSTASGRKTRWSKFLPVSEILHYSFFCTTSVAYSVVYSHRRRYYYWLYKLPGSHASPLDTIRNSSRYMAWLLVLTALPIHMFATRLNMLEQIILSVESQRVGSSRWGQYSSPWWTETDSYREALNRTPTMATHLLELLDPSSRSRWPLSSFGIMIWILRWISIHLQLLQ
jgi:hypothetical protein